MFNSPGEMYTDGDSAFGTCNKNGNANGFMTGFTVRYLVNNLKNHDNCVPMCRNFCVHKDLSVIMDHYTMVGQIHTTQQSTCQGNGYGYETIEQCEKISVLDSKEILPFRVVYDDTIPKGCSHDNVYRYFNTHERGAYKVGQTLYCT